MTTLGWIAKVALATSLLVAATSAQFPFSDGPLEASDHSNKVFYDMTDVKEMAGVWVGVNTIFHAYLNSPFIYDGVSKYNLSCAEAQRGGWDYDLFITQPRALTIEVDEERNEDGVLGYVVESLSPAIGNQTRVPIVQYTPNESLLTMQDGSCRKIWPYLDWELGKTMSIRFYRYYIFPGPDDVIFWDEKEVCSYQEEGHPVCTEGTFNIDGEQHTGTVWDFPGFYECIAGPCLDLAFTLPGFVQTQGYVPAFAADGTSSDGGR